MSRLIALLALTLLVLAPASNASAQLLAAKDGPIVYGHHHLNVTNLDEAKKFWVDAIGGVLIKVGPENREIIKFPNALILLRAQKPTAGSKGSTVDHIGFSVKNLRQVVDRIKAGGFRMVTSAEAPPNVKVQDDIGIVEAGPVSGIAYAMAPDETKVELVEMKAQAAPIASHHLHFFGMNKEMQAWYMQTFGASTLALRKSGGVHQREPARADDEFLAVTGACGRDAGTRDRSHRVRSEEPRGVHQEAGSAGDQARRAISPGASTRDLDRVHHRSVGHLHRADRGAG